MKKVYKKNNLQLDEEEREILEAIEKDDIEELDPVEEELERKKLMEAAYNTLQKKKNINIRLSSKDLFRLKEKAIDNGLPYQTLVASLIHQYNEGKITITF